MTHIRLVGYALPTGMPQEPERIAAGRIDAVRAELIRDGIAPARVLDRVAGGAPAPQDAMVGGRRVDISFTR